MNSSFEEKRSQFFLTYQCNGELGKLHPCCPDCAKDVFPVVEEELYKKKEQIRIQKEREIFLKPGRQRNEEDGSPGAGRDL